MKKTTLSLVIALLFCIIHPVAAKDKTYIYRNRADWVKLNKLSNKQLAGQTLMHPCTTITAQQMTDMLNSLELNKAKLLKKEKFDTSNIFTPVEARKYAPLIVKALEQAAPNQVVNMSIVHKRPMFVIRNDFVSVINIYITDEGVNFNFSKLFAKLKGDYKQASRIDESLNKAKSIRVSLTAKEGQVLVPDADAIILKPGYDFASNFAAIPEEIDTTQVIPAKEKATKDQTKSVTTNKQETTNAPQTAKNTEILTPESQTTPAQDVKTRLSELEALKNQALITNAEYKQKRKEILKDL
ncbi:MAG: hypothetical protein HQM16_03895 [Deltaproteobacteria bacterium]|nr:hypothetical protein [Deltaproteobacteria bacterium]